MKILDTSHAVFRPLRIRLAIVVTAFAWAIFELSLGESLWGLFFGLIASYCAWVLLFSYRDTATTDKKND